MTGPPAHTGRASAGPTPSRLLPMTQIAPGAAAARSRIGVVAPVVEISAAPPSTPPPATVVPMPRRSPSAQHLHPTAGGLPLPVTAAAPFLAGRTRRHSEDDDDDDDDDDDADDDEVATGISTASLKSGDSCASTAYRALRPRPLMPTALRADGYAAAAGGSPASAAAISAEPSYGPAHGPVPRHQTLLWRCAWTLTCLSFGVLLLYGGFVAEQLSGALTGIERPVADRASSAAAGLYGANVLAWPQGTEPGHHGSAAAAAAAAVPTVAADASGGGGGGGHDDSGSPPMDPDDTTVVYADHGAVSSENPLCSEAGRDVLADGGSAVDAAIAAALCSGVVNMYSSGIGGGGFMLVHDPALTNASYDAALRDATAAAAGTVEDASTFTVDFRETAPAASHPDMYRANPVHAQVGGLAVGVPGELRGFETAHRRWGRLPWARLFAPAIRLARDGFAVSPHLAARCTLLPQLILGDPAFRAVFAPNGTLPRPGSWIRRTQYADTLAALAADGADAFYTGRIADALVRRVQATGGILTHDDLAQYAATVRPALSGEFRGRHVAVPDLPTSGPVLLSVLRLLDTYTVSARPAAAHASDSNDAKDDNDGDTTTTTTTTKGKNGDEDGEDAIVDAHRMIEAFKFGFAERGYYGDPMDPVYTNITSLRDSFLSTAHRDWARARLTDGTTHANASYYGAGFEDRADHGTMHVAVVDADGMAVSMTCTINLLFGAQLMDPETGIILNDEQDDFSIPGVPNAFQLEPSPYNFVRPGKRPLSSSSPVIVRRVRPVPAPEPAAGATADAGADVNAGAGADVDATASRARAHARVNADGQTSTAERPPNAPSTGGTVEYVSGGSGGSHIVTAVAQVLVALLAPPAPPAPPLSSSSSPPSSSPLPPPPLAPDQQTDLWSAMTAPRLHHQLVPNAVQAESRLTAALQAGLEARAHAVLRLPANLTFTGVESIYRHRNGSLEAVSDPRKGGIAAGYSLPPVTVLPRAP